MKEAVCVLIQKDNKVLAVSRRGATDQWGLPGGKVEEGHGGRLESEATRELLEETNVQAMDYDLSFIYRGDCAGYLTTVYRIHPDKIQGEPPQGDAGLVAWVNWQDLFDGPFGEFNRKVAERVGVSVEDPIPELKKRPLIGPAFAYLAVMSCGLPLAWQGSSFPFWSGVALVLLAQVLLWVSWRD